MCKHRTAEYAISSHLAGLCGLLAEHHSILTYWTILFNKYKLLTCLQLLQSIFISGTIIFHFFLQNNIFVSGCFLNLLTWMIHFKTQTQTVIASHFLTLFKVASPFHECTFIIYLCRKLLWSCNAFYYWFGFLHVILLLWLLIILLLFLSLLLMLSVLSVQV